MWCLEPLSVKGNATWPDVVFGAGLSYQLP